MWVVGCVGGVWEEALFDEYHFEREVGDYLFGLLRKIKKSLERPQASTAYAIMAMTVEGSKI